MDISTQSAVCYLSSPTGVSSLNPYPCKLFWESESDLLIGWADNFRHLELIHTQAGGTEETSSIFARTTADWQADFIICGLTSFDSEHVLLLGYVPPDVDTDEVDCPEVQVLKHATGELVSVDALPIRGDEGLLRGPWSYNFTTNYRCFSRRRDFHRWNLHDSRSTRGGNRGLAPTCFISSGQDFIVARVRDTNDRIFSALEQRDLQLAVTLAVEDRTSLRQYQLHDLVSLYIDDLLDRNLGDLAGTEVKRLVGKDPILWERWIMAFAAKKQLRSIAYLIPTMSPRLPPTVYDIVLEHFLQTDSKMFLWAVRQWAPIQPPLFDHPNLLQRLEAADNIDQYCLEAEAELYLIGV